MEEDEENSSSEEASESESESGEESEEVCDKDIAKTQIVSDPHVEMDPDEDSEVEAAYQMESKKRQKADLKNALDSENEEGEGYESDPVERISKRRKGDGGKTAAKGQSGRSRNLTDSRKAPKAPSVKAPVDRMPKLPWAPNMNTVAMHSYMPSQAGLLTSRKPVYSFTSGKR